jgi:methyl-accepting chemotaxis protein
MSSFSFAKKMSIIGAVFTVPIVLLIVVLYLQMNADGTFSAQERLGVRYTKALRPLFADLEAYRRSAGNPSTRTGIANDVDADFAAVLAFDAGAGRALRLTDPLEALHAKWQARKHADTLLTDFIALLGSVSDNSNMTLDPILDGYYVGDTMVNKAPSLIDSVAQAAALGTRALRAGKLSVGDRIAMTIAAGQLQAARDGIDHNLPIAIAAAPYVGSSLQRCSGSRARGKFGVRSRARRESARAEHSARHRRRFACGGNGGLPNGLRPL